MDVICCHDLQTKKGTKARGCTSWEFMYWVMPEAYSQAVLAGIKDPIFAFDNNHIHHDVQEHPEMLGLAPANILKLPNYSPDFNKAIEHNHAYTQSAFMAELRDHPFDEPLDPVKLRQLLERVFFHHTTVKMVCTDVDSMRQTWDAVIERKGGYPIPKLM